MTTKTKKAKKSIPTIAIPNAVYLYGERKTPMTKVIFKSFAFFRCPKCKASMVKEVHPCKAFTCTCGEIIWVKED